jgi:flagellar hook-basal body complex protein FliE
MPIQPITSATSGISAPGPEFQVQAPAQGAGSSSPASSFGSVLLDQLDNLNGLQQTAATQSQALATGQADDPSAVVMQVEQAALAMQLAVQVRNKAVDAYQELFRMSI